MTHAHFLARRRRLQALLGDGIAIIPTAPEVIRNRDAHYPYRPDSDFWYLTGFPEPEAVLVLVGGKRPRSILFCRPKHLEREIWDGFRYGPTAAAKTFEFDAAYPIEQLTARLPKLLANREMLWHSLGVSPDWDQRLGKALDTVRQHTRSGQRPPEKIHDLRTVLDALRSIKDAAEIEQMKTAAQLTSDAHCRAMKVCQPGMMEYALEAELTYEFRRRGADAHAYTPIVAGGSNACVLHYVANNQTLKDGDLVLIDAGCEWKSYAADITRTFPVNGRFSAAQRDCYEIVLSAQQAAIEAIRPGVSFMAPHEAALRILVQGMLDLGLLKGTRDGLIESEAYKPFYMHRTSHWLGLDVHDVGPYKDTKGQWLTLVPGQVLTVEPGLYLRAGEGVPDALAGIGIRIEDDVRVTETGAEVYTTAPKTVAEIEGLMGNYPRPPSSRG